MPKLPVVSGAEAVRAFKKDDWEVVRQTGSHIIMIKQGHIASLSIPQHRELAPGTLRALIRCSDWSVEEFIDLL